MGKQSLIMPKKNLKDHGIVMITPEVAYTYAGTCASERRPVSSRVLGPVGWRSRLERVVPDVEVAHEEAIHRGGQAAVYQSDRVVLHQVADVGWVVDVNDRARSQRVLLALTVSVREQRRFLGGLLLLLSFSSGRHGRRLVGASSLEDD